MGRAVQAYGRGLRGETPPARRPGRQPAAVRDHPRRQAIDASDRRREATTVRAAYELAATGHTDWEVADATGLKKTQVGELLTNPIHAGRLRTGEPAGVAAIVEPALWSKVQTMRELRRTRTPGRIVKRHSALRLRCSGCGRFLYGDVGRYRHPAPTCDAFIATTPTIRRGYRTGRDKRIQGHSEREESGRRLARTRDVLAWQREMAQLDAEEQVARGAVEPERLSSVEVVAYLRSLPSLWADAGPEARQVLATALFARTDVMGFERMEYELTPDAVELGLGAALPAAFEIMPRKIGEFGRGERI